MNAEKLLARSLPPFLRPYWRRIQASPIGYRLAKGAFWSLAGAVISRGLALVASVLVARLLGTEIFGELGIIRTTVGMFGTLAGFGLGTTATKFIAEFRDQDPVKAGRVMALSQAVALITGGLMAGLLAIFAPWLAAHTLAAPHLAGLLRVSALLLFFSAINGAESGALAGFEAFRAIATRNFWAGLANFPLMLGGVYFFGLAGAVWALVLGMVLNWLLNYLAVRQAAHIARVPYTFRHCLAELRILWDFSLPAVLAGVMVGPVKWACDAMLVNQPGGYSEMGIFAASIVFQQMVLFMSEMLKAPLLSILSNTGEAKSDRLEKANILSSWFLGLLPAVLFLCFPEIAEALFGSGYVGYHYRATFALVSYYTCLMTYRSGLLRVLQSKGLLWLGLLNNMVWAGFLLLSFYFLAPLGAVGLAGSYAIAYVASSLIFVPVYAKQCGVPTYLLISKQTTAIWAVLTILLVAVFYDIPIPYRALLFPAVICLVGWELKSIWVRRAT